MRLVLHPIRVPGMANFVEEFAQVNVRFPGVKQQFSMSNDEQGDYAFDPPLTDGRLRTEIEFNDKIFRLAVHGIWQEDQLNLRLENEHRLNAWVVHSLLPPSCQAECEDSGEVGFPCVECRKGDMVVVICC